MSQEDTIVKGLKAVAAHFGKSLRQVQRWALAPDFPRLSGRRFDLFQIKEWLDLKDGKPPARARYEGDLGQPFLPAEPRGKEAQEARLKKISADIKELELKKMQGEVVERRQVEQMFVSRILAVKQGLLALSRSLPPQLINCESECEIEIIISRVVRGLLEEFSRPLPSHLAGSGSPHIEPESESSPL